MSDADKRIDQLSEELEVRCEKLRKRLSNLEYELDQKASDLDYALDRVNEKIRALERKADRGY